MAIDKKTKQDLIIRFGGNEANTGKTEVQIAILTEEINNITKHSATNKKDHSSKRGLFKKVSRRKALLSYLERIDIERYRTIVKELSIRK